MKRLFSIVLSTILLGFSVSGGAAESHPHELNYKKKGFFLGTELGALIGFSDRRTVGAPGKLDLLIGYQINPYISVGADLWTFWFLAYTAEAQVKVNFTDKKISPYAVGSIGAGIALNAFDDDGDNVGFLTYSAGFGVDFHLWRKSTLFAETKYRGGSGFDNGDFLDSEHGMEIGVGCRWIF